MMRSCSTIKCLDIADIIDPVLLLISLMLESFLQRKNTGLKQILSYAILMGGYGLSAGETQPNLNGAQTWPQEI